MLNAHRAWRLRFYVDMPDCSSQPSHVDTRWKLRVGLIWAGALWLGVTLAFLVWPRPPAYWAFSAILVHPYTNAVFARSFETEMTQSIPGLRRLTVSPESHGTNAPYGAGIRLMALGLSPQEAQEAAERAATRLCTIVEQRYGAKAVVTQHPGRTGRWLFLFELKLRLERLVQADI
jgi:hypothetical protein